MKTRTHAPADAPTTLDPITVLHMAVVQAAEQTWELHGTPEAERERLRPGVAALAQAAADRLRSEHLARTAQP